MIMDLNLEIEIIQTSIYCNIITMLIKEHTSLSVNKLIVFSYLVKKESLIQNSIFKASNKKDIVNKYLSMLSGDLNNLFSSYKYILSAIHILLKNEVLKLEGIIISKTNKLDIDKFVYHESDFTKKVIEKTKTMSDKQFMREVLSNV